MEKFLLISLIWMVSLSMVHPLPNAKSRRSSGCSAYNYCQGEHFPVGSTIRSRHVRCDIVPNPTEHCCLPQSRHLVCYNIVVDGLYLNYQTNPFTRSTNFTGLCDEMVQSMGKTLNRHTSVTLGSEGGRLIWRQNDWHTVNEGGRQHIVSLACGIQDD